LEANRFEGEEMSKETFIPAFPPNAGWRDADINCRGMTLRDYFAAAALHGLLANPATRDDDTAVIRASYGLADLMLAERAKC